MVEGDSYSVVRIIFVRPSQVADSYCRPSVNGVLIEKELLEYILLGTVVLSRQDATFKDARNVPLHNPLSVFYDDGVHSAFNLEELRIVRVVGVAADSELEAVFLADHTLLTEAEVVRIEIETDYWVSSGRLELAVSVKVQVRLDEVLNGSGLGFCDVILHLEATP